MALAVASPWSWFAIRPLGGLVDFIAIALPLLALAAGAAWIVLAARLGRWWPVAAAASTAAMALVAVAGPWIPQHGPAPLAGLRVVTANLEAKRSDALVAALLDQRPDVLVVNELHVDVDAKLSRRFAHRQVSRLVFTAKDVKVNGTTDNRAGVGVYSDLPLTLLPDDTGLPEGLPGLRVRVDAPSGPVVLYGLHLSKPSPLPDGFSTTFGAQRRVAARVLERARREADPVVLAGDFNISDRQDLYREIAGSFADAGRAAWGGPTSVKPNLLWRSLLLRVDYVFRSDGWCAADAQRFVLPGADHRGVAVRVGPCPEG